MRELITIEVRQFFRHPRSLHFIPLTLLGIFLVLWPYFTSPFVPIFIILFAGLEPQFSNILFRTPRELESVSVLPVKWRHVVVAKNIASILLALSLGPIIIAILIYFSPLSISIVGVTNTILYLSTVLFPLIHIGNMRSIQHPRRKTGWQVDDLAGCVEMLVNLAIVSIPYTLFVEVTELPLLCIPYAAGSILFWWRYSVPRVSAQIDNERITLCMTT